MNNWATITLLIGGAALYALFVLWLISEAIYHYKQIRYVKKHEWARLFINPFKEFMAVVFYVAVLLITLAVTTLIPSI